MGVAKIGYFSGKHACTSLLDTIHYIIVKKNGHVSQYFTFNLTFRPPKTALHSNKFSLTVDIFTGVCTQASLIRDSYLCKTIKCSNTPCNLSRLSPMWLHLCAATTVRLAWVNNGPPVNTTARLSSGGNDALQTRKHPESKLSKCSGWAALGNSQGSD